MAAPTVTCRVPDFVGPDGTEYSEIEVIVSSTDGLEEAVNLIAALPTFPVVSAKPQSER